MVGKSVKIVILLAMSLAVTMAMDDEMAELAKMLRDECSGETGVDIGLLDKINAGEKLMPDPKLKCYIKCVMETGGMMSDGEMDIEAVLAIISEEQRAKHEAGLRACGTKKGADDCDTAYLTQVCWQTASPADYYLV